MRPSFTAVERKMHLLKTSVAIVITVFIGYFLTIQNVDNVVADSDVTSVTISHLHSYISHEFKCESIEEVLSGFSQRVESSKVIASAKLPGLHVASPFSHHPVTSIVGYHYAAIYLYSCNLRL